MAVSPDGATVWIAHNADDSLKVLAAATLETVAELKTGRFPIRVEFTHDGRHIIVTNARSDTLSVYDAVDHALVREVELGAEGDQSASFFGGLASLFSASNASVPIGIQPAPGRAWIALAERNRVVELDADTWTAIRTIDAGEEPDGMAWSPLTAGDD